MDPRIQSPSELSLIARLGVALTCFEAYCVKHELDCESTRSFLSHMWDWPLVATPDQFHALEERETALVETGLGGPMPADIEALLALRGISGSDFRTLVESTVEVLYGSYYGASDDDGSLGDLARVVSLCEHSGINPPPLDAFGESRFCDAHGWGKSLSTEERDAWRRVGPSHCLGKPPDARRPT